MCDPFGDWRWWQPPAVFSTDLSIPEMPPFSSIVQLLVESSPFLWSSGYQFLASNVSHPPNYFYFLRTLILFSSWRFAALLIHAASFPISPLPGVEWAPLVIFHLRHDAKQTPIIWTIIFSWIFWPSLSNSHSSIILLPKAMNTAPDWLHLTLLGWRFPLNWASNSTPSRALVPFAANVAEVVGY